MDDNIIHIKHNEKQTLQQAFIETLQRIEHYTNSNKLALNPDKSRIMIISKDKEIKQNLSVEIWGKTLTHQPKLLILGNILNEDLNWDYHVKTLVIPALANRARSLKIVTKFVDPKFIKQYSTAAPQSLLTNITKKIKTKC